MEVAHAVDCRAVRLPGSEWRDADGRKGMDVMIRKVRSVLLYRRGRARMVQSSSDREGA